MAKRKIVKPGIAEQQRIDRELRKKYPHMMKEDWVKRLKRNVRKELLRRRKLAGFRTSRTTKATEELKKAGLTGEEIRRLRKR